MGKYRRKYIGMKFKTSDSLGGYEVEIIDGGDRAGYVYVKFTKPVEFIKEIYEIFDVWMLENCYFVFADLLFLTYKIFKKYPKILENYAQNIDYILIDEYQDLNNAQDTVR